jgi:hypothetical protein
MGQGPVQQMAVMQHLWIRAAIKKQIRRVVSIQGMHPSKDVVYEGVAS